MKSGGSMSNAEKWMAKAEEWKLNAQDLAAELVEVTRQRDELRESLDHIGEIACPDRVLDSERIERLTRMVEMLMNRAGLDVPPLVAQDESGDEDGENEHEDDAEEDEDEQETEQRIEAIK
jgi:hypothetical protein